MHPSRGPEPLGPAAPAGLWRTVFALALASAVGLGTSRFAYALLLPPMREDLGWSYALSGGMNTLNAAGYLVGALLMPGWLARFDARRVVVTGCIAACVLLALHACTRSSAWLALWRWGAGVASTASFAGGGVLAAQLAQRPEARHRSGLILGVYYGGTGLGIVLSAVLVPWWIAADDGAEHEPGGLAGWQGAWLALAAVSAVASGILVRGTRDLRAPARAAREKGRFRWRDLGWGLSGYSCFGLGYIGYMTFIVLQLKEQGLSPTTITVFYALLGLGVMSSSFLWARLLHRHRSGWPMAVLNALLALATVLPVLNHSVPVALLSGVLFGSVFLSVVASTTALVRHNLPPAAWPAGIAAFTLVFAAGQIAGPLLVGWMADGASAGDGLRRGFSLSAALLALGAVLAWRQKALPQPEHHRP